MVYVMVGIRPFVCPAVPPIDSSSGVQLVCCQRRVPAVDGYLMRAPALSSKRG